MFGASRWPILYMYTIWNNISLKLASSSDPMNYYYYEIRRRTKLRSFGKKSKYFIFRSGDSQKMSSDLDW